MNIAEGSTRQNHDDEALMVWYGWECQTCEQTGWATTPNRQWAALMRHVKAAKRRTGQPCGTILRERTGDITQAEYYWCEGCK